MNVRVNESMTAPSHVGEKRELWVHIVPTGKIFSRLWLFDNKNIYSRRGLSDLNRTHTLTFKELQWIMSDWRMHWLLWNETMSATTRMFLFHVAFDNFVVSSDSDGGKLSVLPGWLVFEWSPTQGHCFNSRIGLNAHFTLCVSVRNG